MNYCANKTRYLHRLCKDRNKKSMHFGTPVMIEELIKWEETQGIDLPTDYEEILQCYNGFAVNSGNCIYGLQEIKQDPKNGNWYEIGKYQGKKLYCNSAREFVVKEQNGFEVKSMEDIITYFTWFVATTDWRVKSVIGYIAAFGLSLALMIGMGILGFEGIGGLIHRYFISLALLVMYVGIYLVVKSESGEKQSIPFYLLGGILLFWTSISAILFVKDYREGPMTIQVYNASCVKTVRTRFDFFTSGYKLKTDQGEYMISYDTYYDLYGKEYEEIELEVYPYSDIIDSYRVSP